MFCPPRFPPPGNWAKILIDAIKKTAKKMSFLFFMIVISYELLYGLLNQSCPLMFTKNKEIGG